MDNYKIQSVIDMQNKFYPFTINSKPLETLLFQGGMGVDISTFKLAKACSDIGMAGTISTTASNYIKELKESLSEKINGIIGLNNLHPTTGYDEHYEVGKNLDFIATAAGVGKDILIRLKSQSIFNKEYFTIPLFSSIKQVINNLKRDPGYIILETTDAGGHNGVGKGFEETIEEYKEAINSGELVKGNNKVILAGGIRKPEDHLKALSAGFDASQLGSMLLLSEEANIDDNYRNLIINSNDVGNIPSPAGLVGSGYFNEGVMKRVLKGESIPKKCLKPGQHCLKDCSKINISAETGGIEQEVGDYCIKSALDNLHNSSHPDDCLYFCGKNPQELFIVPYLKENNLSSLPVKEIIKQFLVGVYDHAFDYLSDKQRFFLEEKLNFYKQNPLNLSAKILAQ
jgi:nitronate monooxygenase